MYDMCNVHTSVFANTQWAIDGILIVHSAKNKASVYDWMHDYLNFFFVKGQWTQTIQKSLLQNKAYISFFVIKAWNFKVQNGLFGELSGNFSNIRSKQKAALKHFFLILSYCVFLETYLWHH